MYVRAAEADDARMANAEEYLRRWTEAGLVDADQADRIRAYERGASTPPAGARDDERPGITEAVLYLGVAVVVAGAIVLGAESWNDLESWARIAALGVPAVLAFFAGVALRSLDQPPYRRAADLAWLATVALAAGTAVVSTEAAGVDDYFQVLVFGVTATVVASTLWAANPGTLQMLGLGGGLFWLGAGMGNSVDESSAIVMGMTWFGVGVFGVLLAEAGLLQPKPVARTIFSAFAISGPYVAGLDGSVLWAELTVFAVGLALIALAVQRNAFVYMVIAVAGMFVGLITFVFEHFADTIGVAPSLLLCGAAIIGGVLLLAATRASTRGQTT